MADKKEYIERGALLAMCKRQIECEWNTLASPGTWAHAFEDFSDLVEQTPAADVVEVRHGEWIRKDGFLVCSECDATKPYVVLNDTIHYWRCDYCNRCGAEMDVRKEQT